MCCTYSHRPRPPACGHTGTPKCAASSSTASTSFSAAEPAGVDLAVVDRVGLQQLLEQHLVRAVLAGGDTRSARPRGGSRRGRARRRGSSAPRSSAGRNGSRCRIHSIACGDVPHLVGVGHQLALAADLLAHHLRSGARRTATSTPTLILKRVQPSASDSRHSRRTFVLGVAEPAGRGDVRGVAVAAQLGLARGLARLARAQQVERLVGGRARRRGSGSRSSATNCSGVRSATSFQTGLPSRFAQRSQTAFTIAAVARWITPFSGPSQRSCDVVRERAAERRRSRR